MVTMTDRALSPGYTIQQVACDALCQRQLGIAVCCPMLQATCRCQHRETVNDRPCGERQFISFTFSEYSSLLSLRDDTYQSLK